jgi:predicted exporter/lauroyl/myristoyl acyltransferase
MTRRFRFLPWLALLTLIVIGLLRLHFDVEILNLLPSDVPAVEGLKLYQQHFANARELIITVRSPDAETTEAAARAIAETLSETGAHTASVAWQPPWLEHPGQSAELLAYLWLNQPPGVFGELTNRLAEKNLPALLASAREQLATSMSPGEIAQLSYDPYGLTRLPASVTGAAPAFGQEQEMFASADGTFRIIFVQANHDLVTYRDCATWLNNLKGRVQKFREGSELFKQVIVGYTGRPAFVSEIAGGMEHDLTISVAGTSLIIAVLFWLAHRRWKPMLWLLTLLALILAGTLALGGLIFGAINVVSMGFAAILLGLAVDYAVVHYQEALAHPDLSVPEIRRAIAPSIFWAAVTTISAFLVLNFGGLPGLAQLGSLVGVGIALAAFVMIFAFLPPLFPDRRKPRQNSPDAFDSTKRGVVSLSSPKGGEGRGEEAQFSKLPLTPTLSPLVPRGERETKLAPFIFAATAALILFSLDTLLLGFPKMDSTANALRPRNSEAYAALDEIKHQLSQKHEPLWLLVSGKNEREVATRLDAVKFALDGSVSNQTLAGFTLPNALWPRPEFQAANRKTAQQLASERETLHNAALTGGFTENSTALTAGILETWQHAALATNVFWPTNEMSRWIFDKLVARSSTNLFALGLLYLPENQNSGNEAALAAQLPRENVWLSGWELLGNGILSSVKKNLWKLLLPIVGLVLVSLGLAFRRWTEVLLSVAILIISGFCLLAVMRLAGWSWNLLNLMALPLILGTGVDYSIFMQLALRRHHGDLQMAHRSVGRALLLCGATAVSGFGALALSSNAGMASLGQICAVGIACNVVISVFLLPVWWKTFTGGRVTVGKQIPAPSSLYRPEFWRMGLGIVHFIPRRLCVSLAQFFASVYWIVGRHRRKIVIQNLLPALENNHEAAEKKARELFQNFAVKVIDLWRYEAGLPIANSFGTATGWDHFAGALAQKRGVLLLTPHLGNWEFGGPWLTQKGVSLLVVTLAEPGQNFTQLRQASRARWNIETLVIGTDPFAFIEIIKRLEAGATVALLVDRPTPATEVTTELFGRPFAASIAAAELARASGCVLLPVYLPREGDSYSACVLPPVPYDRAALRDREARRRLTQEIMRAFEPVIRQHLNEWYHFIPIWKK